MQLMIIYIIDYYFLRVITLNIQQHLKVDLLIPSILHLQWLTCAIGNLRTILKEKGTKKSIFAMITHAICLFFRDSTC